MKIKMTKKLNLPELIQYVWENDIGSESFESKFGVEVIFGENRAVIMNHFVGKDDTFTVEVEENLTMDTLLEDVVEVLKDNHIIDYEYISIAEIKNDQTSEIYVARSGKLHLIWSRESGIPESGVLEVDMG